MNTAFFYISFLFSCTGNHWYLQFYCANHVTYSNENSLFVQSARHIKGISHFKKHCDSDCNIRCNMLFLWKFILGILFRNQKNQKIFVFISLKVFQGLLRSNKDYHDTKSSIARLWVHECFRYWLFPKITVTFIISNPFLTLSVPLPHPSTHSKERMGFIDTILST